MRYLASLEEVDETGYVKDICDIKTPVRIDGALKQ
jgi:hypothetical protein